MTPSKTENPRMKKALKLIAKEKIVISNRTSDAKGVQIKGHTLQKSPQAISITFDIDGRAVKSNCSCFEFKKTVLHNLRKDL